MTVKRWDDWARRLLCGALAVVACAGGHAANNFEAGKTAFNNFSCAQAGCHTGVNDGLLNPSGGDARVLQDKLNLTTGTMRASNPDAAQLNPLRTAGPINDTVSDIAAYIRRPNFPVAVVSTGFVNMGSAVVTLTTSTAVVRVTNNGDANLNLTASVADTTNFNVTPAACTIAFSGTNFCDLTVTFRPQVASPPSITSTLNLVHDGFSGGATVNLTGTGLLPLALVGPASVQFNSGDLAKSLRVIDNIGNRVRVCRTGGASFPAPEAFQVDGVTLDGSGCALVSTSGTLPRNIDLSVTFLSPLGSGPKNAVLTYQRLNASSVEIGSPVTVQLQGNLGPVISFDDTDPFNHGANDQTEVDGSAFVERIIRISNAGNGPLTLGSFVISSVDPAHPEIAGEYTLAGTGCQAVATLAAFSPPCSLTIRFDPAALGLRAAKLTVTSDGKNLPQPQVIPLNGIGKHGPRLAVTEGALTLATTALIDFTSQRLGQVYPARTITLTNGGTLGDLELSLPAASAVTGFSAVPAAGCTNLAPAASCSLVVTFTPTGLQHFGGAFDIGSRAAGGGGAFTPFRLNLSGDGTDQAAALSWREPTVPTTVVTTVAYGEVQAGNSLERRVLVFNSGPGSVLLQVINAVGLDASSFTVDATACKLGQFLGEASGCEVILRFAPGTAGVKSASIQVISNGNGPFALPISGTGLAGANASVLTMSPATLAFGATAAGAQSEPQELTLTNSGTLPMTVQALAATGPFVLQSKTCLAPPFVLLPASQCTLALSFRPGAAGAATGALQVTTDASTTPAQAALSGEGRSAADVSGGGCVAIGGDVRTDPTLWALVLLAGGVLWQRRRAGARRKGATTASLRDEIEP